MASYAFLFLPLAVLSLLLLPFPSHCTDPNPLQDFCVADLKSPIFLNGYPCKNPSEVTSKDFFYDGLTEESNDYNYLGLDLKHVGVTEFPGLNTLGLSTNRVSLLPGGMNPPHTHPLAAELSLVTKGKIFVGWVSIELNLYWKIISSGELFVVPQGLMHFQLNVGKGNARFHAFFNSQNPGVQFIGQALFNTTPTIPNEVLVKALQANESIIDLIKFKFSKIKF